MDKICLGIMKSVQIDYIEQIKLFKRVGFDGFFSEYNVGETAEFRKIADELGLIYQSIHAPYYKMNHMWYESEETEAVKAELLACVDECAEYNVPIMVAHPFIGFDVDEANEFGVANFKEIVDYAMEKGVKIAFENVEGESYLKALMTAFENYENVGFCWDTGHEMCYNRGKDMLELYGDRLIATHINDNMGVSGDKITCVDDLHLLPFDGIKDWENAVERLDKCGYSGILTFELKISGEIDRNYKTAYSKMEFSDYVKTAYERAVSLSEMRKAQ